MSEQDRDLTSRVGQVEIDWPLMIGYYGGIGLAIAFEVIEPPLALFIAGIPFFKMLNRPQASRPTRFVSQILQGMAKPVGGDADSAVRLTASDRQKARRPTIWQEARALADQPRAQRQRAAGGQ